MLGWTSWIITAKSTGWRIQVIIQPNQLYLENPRLFWESVCPPPSLEKNPVQAVASTRIRRSDVLHILGPICSLIIAGHEMDQTVINHKSTGLSWDLSKMQLAGTWRKQLWRKRPLCWRKRIARLAKHPALVSLAGCQQLWLFQSFSRRLLCPYYFFV